MDIEKFKREAPDNPHVCFERKGKPRHLRRGPKVAVRFRCPVRSPPEPVSKQGDQEQDDRYEEDDISHAYRRPGYSAEPKNSGNDGDDEQRNNETNHNAPLQSFILDNSARCKRGFRSSPWNKSVRSVVASIGKRRREKRMRKLILATVAAGLLAAPMATTVRAEDTTVIKKNEDDKTVIKKRDEPALLPVPHTEEHKTIIKKDHD